jgi:hypothetical protein
MRSNMLHDPSFKASPSYHEDKIASMYLTQKVDIPCLHTKELIQGVYNR